MSGLSGSMKGEATVGHRSHFRNGESHSACADVLRGRSVATPWRHPAQHDPVEIDGIAA
jgi:hypothetical protein